MFPSGPGSMLLLGVLLLSFLLIQPSPPLKPQVCLLLQEASQVTPTSTHLTLLIASAACPESWAPLRPESALRWGAEGSHTHALPTPECVRQLQVLVLPLAIVCI